MWLVAGYFLSQTQTKVFPIVWRQLWALELFRVGPTCVSFRIDSWAGGFSLFLLTGGIEKQSLFEIMFQTKQEAQADWSRLIFYWGLGPPIVSKEDSFAKLMHHKIEQWVLSWLPALRRMMNHLPVGRGTNPTKRWDTELYSGDSQAEPYFVSWQTRWNMWLIACCFGYLPASRVGC